MTDNAAELARLELRYARGRQDMELWKALAAILEGLPEGSTMGDAVATAQGQRAQRKWSLHYGREAPSW